ncbi:MAG: DUF881 domain-containing protein [Armatimonadota bacterium]|nr:DUF881 domain-containing protein [Armatimonadota bacterium]
MAVLPAPTQESNQNRNAARPNPWSWWTSLFVLCAILGALIGLSFKTQNTIRQTRVPAANYPALVQEYLTLKTNLEKNVTDQQRTIERQNDTIQQIENSADSGSKVTRTLTKELNQANFLAGLTDVQGPGLIVVLNDSKMQIAGGSPSALAIPGAPNLIHDTDINQTVNELKAAGAEAISVNNQRLVGTSPIRCAGPTIYVNNTPQTPPYMIRAIGDPVTLETAMNLPNGVADGLRRMDPAMIRMQRTSHLVISAYAGATKREYAKPIPPPAAKKIGKG